MARVIPLLEEPLLQTLLDILLPRLFPDLLLQCVPHNEKGTSPSDAVRGLLNDFGQCVVLIDERVAYARRLHHRNDLPVGIFETQFTFARSLTESAKAASNCLLVISFPASDTAESPHAQADDVEVGRGDVGD